MSWRRFTTPGGRILVALWWACMSTPAAAVLRLSIDWARPDLVMPASMLAVAVIAGRAGVIPWFGRRRRPAGA
jgi:hypothetical protein